MPRFDSTLAISKGAAQAYIAKALRAYFGEEQVEVVDIAVKALDVDVTIWCEEHGTGTNHDTTFNIHMATEQEKDDLDGVIIVATEREWEEE